MGPSSMEAKFANQRAISIFYRYLKSLKGRGLFMATKFTKNWNDLQSVKDRLSDDDEIAIILNEISTLGYDEIALAKAFEEAGGNEEKTKSIYIRHRIRRRKDVAIYGSAILRQISIETASEERTHLKNELEMLKKLGKTKGNLFALSFMACLVMAFLMPNLLTIWFVILALTFITAFIQDQKISQQIKLLEQKLSNETKTTKTLRNLLSFFIMIGLFYIFYAMG
tara:strand:+ start:109 stop:783 length:675 start_codon:yes stop_codon:yes gene_type:complete